MYLPLPPIAAPRIEIFSPSLKVYADALEMFTSGPLKRAVKPLLATEPSSSFA